MKIPRVKVTYPMCCFCGHDIVPYITEPDEMCYILDPDWETQSCVCSKCMEEQRTILKASLHPDIADILEEHIADLAHMIPVRTEEIEEDNEWLV